MYNTFSVFLDVKALKREVVEVLLVPKFCLLYLAAGASFGL